MWTIIGAALITTAGCGLLFSLGGRRTQLQPEPLWMVEFDDAGIRSEYTPTANFRLSDGMNSPESQFVPPMKARGIWIFFGAFTPRGATDPAACFSWRRIWRGGVREGTQCCALPALVPTKSSKAMGSTSNAYFVVLGVKIRGQKRKTGQRPRCPIDLAHSVIEVVIRFL